MSDDDCTGDACSDATIGEKRSWDACKHPRHHCGGCPAPTQRAISYTDSVECHVDDPPVQNNMNAAVEKSLVTAFTFAKTRRFIAWSPLHEAVASDRLRAAELIIQLRPDSLMLANADRDTPVHYAKLPVMRMIVEKSRTNASIHGYLIQALCTRNDSGRENTPVHLAAVGHDLELIRLMFQVCPAAFEVPDVEREATPVFQAITNGAATTVQFLLTLYPAGFDFLDSDGNTAGHQAAMRVFKFDKEEIVKLLIDAHPEQFCMRNKGGWLPAMFVNEAREVGVWTLLKNAGVTSSERIF